MSIFSETLRNFIEDKNVKVLPMAEYCRLERSTLYKFMNVMNGKRDPGSPELVEKIAQFMCLTSAETHKLPNAWKIVRTGEDIYYTQKRPDGSIPLFKIA